MISLRDSEIRLLELIKQSLFKNGYIANDNYDYSTVLKEACDQSVLALVVSEIPSTHYPQLPEWHNIAEKQLAHFLMYLHEQNKLKDILDKAGIQFVILKGCSSAIYYPDPWKRSMGDIDFLVSPDDYERCKITLFSNGFAPTHNEDSRNIHIKKNKLTYELHRRFSAEDKDIEDVICKEWNSVEMRDIYGYTFPMLPKLSNGIVLLDHMRQHLICGLGLRQIIDWMMYVDTELDDSFWNDEFKTIANQNGLDTLAITTTKMCQKYLGLRDNITWCLSADDLLCDDLLQTLFYSGNFGKKQGKGRLVESVTTAFKREGVFKQLQKAGEYNWNAYKKHRLLKPFCWLYQLFRYIVNGIKSGRNIQQLLEDTQRGEKRAELLKRLRII